MHCVEAEVETTAELTEAGQTPARVGQPVSCYSCPLALFCSFSMTLHTFYTPSTLNGLHQPWEIPTLVTQNKDFSNMIDWVEFNEPRGWPNRDGDSSLTFVLF